MTDVVVVLDIDVVVVLGIDGVVVLVIDVVVGELVEKMGVDVAAVEVENRLDDELYQLLEEELALDAQERVLRLVLEILTLVVGRRLDV